MTSVAIFGVVSVATMLLMHTGMVMFSQNMTLNSAAMRARNDLDRMQEVLRFGDRVPTLIASDGSVATGTTANGVLALHYLGGPFSLRAAGGGTEVITANATTLHLTFSVHPMAATPVPVPGDILFVEVFNEPSLEILTVTVPSGTGNTRSVTVTTTSGLGTQVDPATYCVPGHLFRREAFVFKPNGSVFDLRYYPRVTASKPVSTSTNFRVMANGCKKLTGKEFFTRVTANGKEGTQIAFLTRAGRGASFLERYSTTPKVTIAPVSVVPVQLTVFPSDS
jgi:hypothetical protein